MSKKTKIEWTEATWNPISGCTKISDGCKNCYAEKMANRLKAMGTKGYENGFAVTLHREKLNEPLKRKKPTMYFVCSMGDLFHEDVPFEFIDKIIEKVEYSPHHTFQLLTKRPEIMKQYFEDRLLKSKKWNWILKNGMPKNLWLLVTVEDQEQANKRIPILLNTPAAVRGISIEPTLGKIALTAIKINDFGIIKGNQYINALTGVESFYGSGENPHIQKYKPLDWVIVGGETGAGARPLQYEWVKNIQKQCEAANVPFFFKKWGKLAQSNKSLIDGYIDGVECRAMPEVLK